MKKQKFEIGYHLNSWDLSACEKLEDAFPALASLGVRWYEPLFSTTVSDDYFRRRNKYVTELPRIRSDMDFIKRISTFSNAEIENGLHLSTMYISAELTNPHTWKYELEAIQAAARILKSFGSKVLVMGGGHPAIGRPHTTEEYKAFAGSLEEIGAYTKKLGIKTVYHHHIDCFLETRDQIDRFMEFVDTDLVGLCIDSAHLVLCKSDPVDTLRTYIDHVHHVHFKDCGEYDADLTGDDRYLSFCDLGEGAVDLQGMANVLLENNYDKHVIIELDYTGRPADESCKDNIQYVTNKLGLKLNSK